MTSRRWLLLALAGAAIALLLGRVLATLYADYLWYRALGAAEVWRAKTTVLLLLRGLSATAGGLFVFGNLLAVRHSVISVVLPRRVANIEIGQEVPGRLLLLIVVGLSIFFGALLTIPTGDWTEAALAAWGRGFGVRDPYFQYDFSFFVYWLPFEQSLFLWALLAVLLASAIVIFLYALTPSLRWERGKLYVSTYVRRHLAVLAALMLVLLAWSYRLDAFQILIDGSGADGAFSYVDHKVLIPASLVMQVLALAAALVTLLSTWGGLTRVAVGTVVATVLLSLTLREIAPLVARQFIAPADPAVRERPYLGTRASYTRYAYDVASLGIAEPGFGYASMREAASAVPIWDPAAIRRALEGGGPASPVSAAVGWRASARGLLALVPEGPHLEESLGAGPREPWSVAIVAATRVDERGDIVRVDREGYPFPDELPLPPALVYEGAEGYAIVADSARDIAAPALAGGVSRLVHAWSLQNFRLLLDDLPPAEARIVRHRDVRERLRLLAPFFAQGSAVTPVVLADSLFWTIELYSAAATYPLSAHLRVNGEERTYFRHAATALVHAASGRVRFLPDSAADPLARSWFARFPRVFRAAAVAEPLRALLPPAVDGAEARATAFALVGARTLDPGPLHFPYGVALDADSVIAVGGRTLLGPSTDGAGTLWTAPLLDRDERIVGIAAATGGANRRTVWLPLPAPGPRWSSIVEQLRRPPDPATGRDAGGTRGRVRVVPVAGSLAFVQPFYNWRAQPGPTLSRVALLVGDSLRLGRTLADAAGVTAPGTAPGAPPPGDFRAQVARLYDAMSAALQRGDLRAFGAAYESLGRLLGRAPRSP